MTLWHRILRLPNGRDDLQPLKDEFSKSARRVQESAKNLARVAENISRRKKEDEFERLLHRFRVHEGQD